MFTFISAITIASLSQAISVKDCNQSNYSNFSNGSVELYNNFTLLNENNGSIKLKLVENVIKDVNPVKKEFNTSEWHGWWNICYYNKVKINNYKKYKGVYSQLTPYFSKIMLKCGALSYSNSLSYKVGCYYRTAAYYNCKIDTNVEGSLSTGFGYCDGAFNMNGDIVTQEYISKEMEHTLLQVRNNDITREESLNINLNKDVIDEFDKYYPNLVDDNANVAIGLVGEYSIADIEYRRCSNVNGCERYDESDTHTATIIICNESSLARVFLFTYGSDSSNVYYLG